MAVLCIDSATEALVVGLVEGLDNPRELAGAQRRDLRAQALLRLVDECCVGARVERDEIELVVVGTGPGGFTGLRIGIATARGIAVGLGVPLVGVPTAVAIAAEQLAAANEAAGPSEVRALIDAKRGERFEQVVRRSDRDAGEPDFVEAGPIVVVSHDASAAGRLGIPTVVGLALAARGREQDDPRAVLPVYGREPDAVPRPSVSGAAAPASIGMQEPRS